MSEEMKYCSHCGAHIAEKAVICPKCGVPVKNLALNYFSQKNRIVAAVFAFLFGIFGIHWFYLGRNKYGIISIIFFWTFIPFIISCLHGVKLLLMSDEDFSLLYC